MIIFKFEIRESLYLLTMEPPEVTEPGSKLDAVFEVTVAEIEADCMHGVQISVIVKVSPLLLVEVNVVRGYWVPEIVVYSPAILGDIVAE